MFNIAVNLYTIYRRIKIKSYEQLYITLNIKIKSYEQLYIMLNIKIKS